MSSGEELIDDEGRNPTQQRMDEEETTGDDVDADWGFDDTEDAPHEGEEGQEVV